MEQQHEASIVPEDDSPLEELAKCQLHWLEHCNPLDGGDLASAILTTERATLAHPVVPLLLQPEQHVIARLLRLLARNYRLMQSAGNKAPVSRP